MARPSSRSSSSYSRSSRSTAARSGTGLDTVLFGTCALIAFLLAGVLPSTVREAFASGLRRTIVAPFVSLQAKAELSRTAFLAHDAVTASRDTIALRAIAAESLREENDRLRRLLGLGQQLQWGFVPAEAIHSRALGDEFSITVTAGAQAGIRPFSPVVAPEGLVGMVQSVDPTMSQVIMWAHPDFRVSAMAVDGSTFGIAQAHLGSGPERYLLELRGVPFRDTLRVGTMIASSGLGGVFPRGIPVGTVLSELESAEGWVRTYLLRPAVLPPDIASVMILQPPRAAAGVQGVWTTTANVDSATRAVVAAGDSLVADSAARVAARRATSDSLRRAMVRAADSARAAAPWGPVAPPPAGPARAAPGTTRDSTAVRRSPGPAARPAAPRPAAPRPPTTPAVSVPPRDTTASSTPATVPRP